MKLAQALSEVKKIREQAQEAISGIQAIAYQPASLSEIKDRLQKARTKLETEIKLRVAINDINSSIKIKYGDHYLTLLEARMLRDSFIAKGNMLSGLMRISKTTKTQKYVRNKDNLQVVEYEEIPSVLDYKALEAEINFFNKEARDLDALIQEANWTTEVAGF